MNIIILKKENDFPHIQKLTMRNLVQMRDLQCRQGRIWHLRADRIENQSACARKNKCNSGACAPDARLWAGIPAHFLIRIGGKFLSEILLLQLKIHFLTNKAGLVLVLARQMD